VRGAIRRHARGAAVAAVLLLVALAPTPAPGQVFLASEPHPVFTVGPLFVRATVTPVLDSVAVEILWSLVVPPDRSAADLEQDIYFLWPGSVLAERGAGPGEPALASYVEHRGFTVIDAGRLALFSQSLFQVDTNEPPSPIAGGAPYVTFVRQGGALGLTAPVTYIRIPWTPYQVNRARLMDLQFRAKGLVAPRHASWIENAFWGPRSVITLSFNDVRNRGLFPLYFEHRDRLIRLAEDPSQLMLNFTDAAHLKVDQTSPASSRRHLSETLDDTEVVSLFLDRSEGITPQLLTVQFGYFSGWRAWAPVIIPAAFFILGNLAAPVVKFLGERAARSVRSHFLFRRQGTAASQDSGVVIPRETLARIIPGETTHAQVLHLCGPDAETRERMSAPHQRTLVYRGRQVIPHRRPIFRWLAHVTTWDIEDHEVEISFEHDVVSDVQARVRRVRQATPETG
jgi:hypothetical protein